MVKPRENRVPIMMSDDELRAVDDWRYENRIGTRSDAVRRLVQIGLRLDRHFDALYESVSDLTDLVPQIADHMNKAVNSKDDEAYDPRVLGAILTGFMNQVEGQKRIINILYGVLGEASTLKGSAATAEAIHDADAGADKYYAHINEALKPLAEKWGLDE